MLHSAILEDWFRSHQLHGVDSDMCRTLVDVESEGGLS